MKIDLLFLSFIVSLFPVQSLQAARVDTVIVKSPSMNKEIKAVVITPDNYSTGKEFPTVYLLHGATGSYADLIHEAPALRDYADLYDFIIVCPDGNFVSWYFDSPVNPESRYETYISTELVKWIDKNYKTIKNRAGRAITGVSMGGHGVLCALLFALCLYSRTPLRLNEEPLIQSSPLDGRLFRIHVTSIQPSFSREVH